MLGSEAIWNLYMLAHIGGWWSIKLFAGVLSTAFILQQHLFARTHLTVDSFLPSIVLS